jgi:hypothetical protein
MKLLSFVTQSIWQENNRSVYRDAGANGGTRVDQLQ